MSGAVLLAHRAVVGAGEHGGRPARGPGLRHDLRRAAASRRPRGPAPGSALARSASRSSQISLSRAVSRSARRRELEKTRVERCSAMRSTMRSSTCGQIEAAARGPRPDPTGRDPGGPRPATAELGHVGDGDDDLEVPLLGRRRAARSRPGDRRRGSARPPRRAARSPTARRAGRAWSSRASSRSRLQREVGAALGAGDGVHLVEDDGLDAGERLARRRGEHEEERLGRRDEDVGGRAGEGAALVGRGVAGAHADA